MRIWSLHPHYLDSKGLVALWREGLLALHVLRGQTRGYAKHPQLLRFKNHPSPIAAISVYLHAVVDEAEARNFSFQRAKLAPVSAAAVVAPLTVTAGQLVYETQHLKQKLQIRDNKKYLEYKEVTQFEAHPLFTVIPGGVEVWEKVVIAQF